MSPIERLLRRKAAPLSAREIAERLGCCVPTAYARIRALERAGVSVYTVTRRRPGKRGPAPKAYGVR